MDAERLRVCLEFQVELQELKKLGLSREEIDGFFEFEWELGQDLITALVERGTDDQH